VTPYRRVRVETSSASVRKPQRGQILLLSLGPQPAPISPEISGGFGGLLLSFLAKAASKRRQMGKAGKRRKRQIRKESGSLRLSEIRSLARSFGFEVEVFSPIHCRIHGSTLVDYWPTSSRAWLTHSRNKAEVRTPREVIALAGAHLPDVELLPEGAADHLKALRP